MTKKRKPLKDGVASDFVFGDRDTATPSPSPAPMPEKIDVTPPATPQRGNDIMAQLTAPEKEATIRLTVDLPKSLHQKLSLAAVKTGRSKADIIRYLIDTSFKDD